MTTKQKKKIATWIIVPLMLLIFILDIVTLVLCNRYAARYTIMPESFDGTYSDRIHFLNTENSDAILLESDGHFALIDAGEGSCGRKNADVERNEDDRSDLLLHGTHLHIPPGKEGSEEQHGHQQCEEEQHADEGGSNGTFFHRIPPGFV